LPEPVQVVWRQAEVQVEEVVLDGVDELLALATDVPAIDRAR